MTNILKNNQKDEIEDQKSIIIKSYLSNRDEDVIDIFKYIIGKGISYLSRKDKNKLSIQNIIDDVLNTNNDNVEEDKEKEQVRKENGVSSKLRRIRKDLDFFYQDNPSRFNIKITIKNGGHVEFDLINRIAPIIPIFVDNIKVPPQYQEIFGILEEDIKDKLFKFKEFKVVECEEIGFNYKLKVSIFEISNNKDITIYIKLFNHLGEMVLSKKIIYNDQCDFDLFVSKLIAMIVVRPDNFQINIIRNNDNKFNDSAISKTLLRIQNYSPSESKEIGKVITSLNKKYPDIPLIKSMESVHLETAAGHTHKNNELLEYSFDISLKAANELPDHYFAHYALSCTSYLNGKLDIFNKEAEKSLKLCPDNPYLLGSLGLRRIILGEGDFLSDGVKRIEKAIFLLNGLEGEVKIPGSFNIGLSLYYFQKEDFERSYEYSDKLDEQSGMWRYAMQLAVLANIPDKQKEAKELAELINNNSDFRRVVIREIEKWNVNKNIELKQHLLDSWKRSGLKIK